MVSSAPLKDNIRVAGRHVGKVWRFSLAVGVFLWSHTEGTRPKRPIDRSGSLALGAMRRGFGSTWRMIRGTVFPQTQGGKEASLKSRTRGGP